MEVVVVAQVVERWHFVWAGWVQIPGSKSVILFSLGLGLFPIKSNRTVQTLHSSFRFPIIIYHGKIYQL